MDMEVKTLTETSKEVFAPSERHEIIAAVLRAAERGGIRFSPEACFREYKDEHGNVNRAKWVLSLYRKVSTFEDLDKVKKALGTSFSLEVHPGTRNGVEHVIKGSVEDFRALPKKILYENANPQGSRPQYLVSRPGGV